MENSSNTEPSTLSIGQILGEGWQRTRRYAKIALIFWLLSLVLALVASLPLRATLLAETGNSLILKDLLRGPNYTYLNDFLQNYGSALTPILNQSILIVVLQLLLIIFLTGGLVKTMVVQPARFDRHLFWGSSGTYFWRLLRLTIFFLVVHVLVLVFFGWIYLRVTKGMSPANLESEAIITSCLRWLVPLYLLVATIPLLWQDLAKIALVQSDSRLIYQPVHQGFKMLRKNFVKFYSLALILLVIGLALVGINYLLHAVIDIQSYATIVLSLLATQVIVIARYFMKVFGMGIWFAAS